MINLLPYESPLSARQHIHDAHASGDTSRQKRRAPALFERDGGSPAKAEREPSIDPRPRARILSICDDDGLRLAREMLLLNDGYVVESVASSIPLSVTRVRTFDIALICRSVNADRAMALKEMLQRYNLQIQVLCLAPLDLDLLNEPSSHVSPTPEGLLHAIRLLADRRKASPDVEWNRIGRAR